MQNFLWLSSSPRSSRTKRIIYMNLDLEEYKLNGCLALLHERTESEIRLKTSQGTFPKRNFVIQITFLATIWQDLTHQSKESNNFKKPVMKAKTYTGILWKFFLLHTLNSYTGYLVQRKVHQRAWTQESGIGNSLLLPGDLKLYISVSPRNLLCKQQVMLFIYDFGARHKTGGRRRIMIYSWPGCSSEYMCMMCEVQYLALKTNQLDNIPQGQDQA